MVAFILQFFVVLILSLFLTYIIGFCVLTIRYLKPWKGYSISLPYLKYVIRTERYPMLYEVPKWILIDIIRGRDFFDLFGIWCFTGYYGEGKTMGAVQYAMMLKKRYPHIHIYTNFNMAYQDGKITSWQDLLELPPWTIVIFDEIQSTFTSTQYSDFPIELLWKLTQCRKQNLAVFASSPVYHRMSIQLRESTDYVIECKNMLKRKRWFKYDFYRAANYEKYVANPEKVKPIKEFTRHICVNDADYNLYDTKETVQRQDIAGDNKKVKGMTKNDVVKLIDEKIKPLERKITA